MSYAYAKKRKFLICDGAIKEAGVANIKQTISILMALTIILFLISGCAKPIQEPEINQVTASDVKEFTMTAKKFEFMPSAITVNKGDKVKITITSIDATHGFLLPDFNINEKLEPNKPVIVEFVADKAGAFTFRCNIICGSGHSSMSGALIVK